jgi:hypothetical protein
VILLGKEDLPKHVLNVLLDGFVASAKGLKHDKSGNKIVRLSLG